MSSHYSVLEQSFLLEIWSVTRHKEKIVILVGSIITITFKENTKLHDTLRYFYGK